METTMISGRTGPCTEQRPRALLMDARLLLLVSGGALGWMFPRMIQDCKAAGLRGSRRSASTDQEEMCFLIIAWGFLFWVSDKEFGWQGHGTGGSVLTDRLGLCKLLLPSQDTSDFNLMCINFCVDIRP